MSRSPLLRLADMVAAGRQVIAWTHACDAQSFAEDAMRVAAVERDLFILGEAAKDVPEEVRAMAPAYPWRDVVRMRDFLAHGYASVEVATLLRIAQEDLPRDLPLLEALLARLDAELPHT